MVAVTSWQNKNFWWNFDFFFLTLFLEHLRFIWGFILEKKDWNIFWVVTSGATDGLLNLPTDCCFVWCCHNWWCTWKVWTTKCDEIIRIYLLCILKKKIVAKFKNEDFDCQKYSTLSTLMWIRWFLAVNVRNYVKISHCQFWQWGAKGAESKIANVSSECITRKRAWQCMSYLTQ